MMEAKKLCVDCKTTKTPLWRTGPHGPRSLCNACGIRYRKRKMADENQNPSSDKPWSNNSTINSITNDDDHLEGVQIDESFKIRLNNLSNQMLVPTSPSPSPSWSSSSSSSSPMKRQRSSSKREMREVEQGAVLLMFLSYGSVVA